MIKQCVCGKTIYGDYEKCFVCYTKKTIKDKREQTTLSRYN